MILIYICYNFIRVSHSQKSSPLPKSFLPHPSFPIFFLFTKPHLPSTFSVSVTRTLEQSCPRPTGQQWHSRGPAGAAGPAGGSRSGGHPGERDRQGDPEERHHPPAADRGRPVRGGQSGRLSGVLGVWLSYPWDSKCRKIEGN